MTLSTKSAATGILVLLSLIFFGAGVWLHVYHPEDAAFNAAVWGIFSTTFGGVLVILNADAKSDPPPSIIAKDVNPSQSNSVVPKE